MTYREIWDKGGMFHIEDEDSAMRHCECESKKCLHGEESCSNNQDQPLHTMMGTFEVCSACFQEWKRDPEKRQYMATEQQ